MCTPMALLSKAAQQAVHWLLYMTGGKLSSSCSDSTKNKRAKNKMIGHVLELESAHQAMGLPSPGQSNLQDLRRTSFLNIPRFSDPIWAADLYSLLFPVSPFSGHVWALLLGHFPNEQGQLPRDFTGCEVVLRITWADG